MADTNRPIEKIVSEKVNVAITGSSTKVVVGVGLESFPTL
jgi:hypothetical protein